MVGLYSLLLLQSTKRQLSKKVLLIYSVVYGLLGLTLCVPWMGFLLSPLTPITFPYLAALIWLPFGYYFSIAVAMGFIMVNIALGVSGIRSG